MKTRSLLTAAITLSTFTFTQGAIGDTFLLDFEDGTAGNLAGWESFAGDNTSIAYDGTATGKDYSDLASGDITIATSGVEFIRGDSDVLGSAANAMLNDLHLANNAPGGPYNDHVTITISGLSAGTYELTTYHIIPTTVAINFPIFDFLVQDADSPSFGQNAGSFQMGNASSVTTVNTTIKSNGTDDVLIRLLTTSVTNGGTSNWTGINGLEIAVPEPGSLALLGLGGLLVGARRRRA